MLTIYLAGPMTGHPLHNFPAFADATAKLRALGHEVISPAENDLAQGFEPSGHMPDGREELAAVFSFDLAAVIDCGTVVLLPGWEKSKGVAVELAVAWYTNAAVFEFDERRADLLRPITLPRPDIRTGQPEPSF